MYQAYRKSVSKLVRHRHHEERFSNSRPRLHKSLDSPDWCDPQSFSDNDTKPWEPKEQVNELMVPGKIRRRSRPFKGEQESCQSLFGCAEVGVGHLNYPMVL